MEASLFQTISMELIVAVGVIALLVAALLRPVRQRWIQSQVDLRVQQFRDRLSQTLVLQTSDNTSLRSKLTELRGGLALQERAESHLDASAKLLRLPNSGRMTTERRLSALRRHFRSIESGLESTTHEFLPDPPRSGSDDLERSLEKYLSQVEILRATGALGKVVSDKHTLETGKRLLKRMKEAKASGAKAGGYLDDAANVSDDLAASNIDDLLLASADDLQASSLLLSGADDVVTAGTDDLLAGSLDDLANIGPIPVVTLIFSGGREAFWMIDGSTNADDALRNILHDLAGAGIGSLYGGLLGSLGGPLGTVLGAAAGGYIGRKLSDSSKFEPVTDAGSAYRFGREKAKREITAGANELFVTVGSDCNYRSDDLLRRLESAPKPGFAPIVASATDLRIALGEAIRVAHKAVGEFCLRESAAVAEDPLKLRVLGLAIRAQTCEGLDSTSAQICRQLRDLERSLPQEEEIQSDPLRCIEAMLSNGTPLFGHKREALEKAHQAQAVLESALELTIEEQRLSSWAWRAESAEAYARSVRMIQTNASTALGVHMELVRDHGSRVEELKESFVAQLDRFHIKYSMGAAEPSESTS